MKHALSFALTLAALLPFAPNADAQGRRKTPRARTPIARATEQRPTALVVLLENGGVSANLEECIGPRSKKIRIPVAVSGGACFALRRNESLPAALVRLKDTVAALALNPSARAWKVETISADEWVERTSDWLLEEISKCLTARNGIRRIYDRVVLLEDEELTPANAVAQIRALGRRYDIDVHTLVHGSSNTFYGYEEAAFNEETFFGPLRRAGLSFRAVYQMNCVSGTLTDEWTELGAKVVNGTLDERNNYMPQSYFHFQNEWVRGATFGNAVTQSYAQARVYSEPIYEALGLLQEVEDSRMRVVGETGLRAKPTPLQVARRVAVAGVETALEMAARLQAAGRTLQQAATDILAAGHDALACADALRRKYGARAGEVAAALASAGVELGEVGAALAGTFACSAGEMFDALREASGSAGRALRVMVRRQFAPVKECVNAALDAGVSVAAIAAELHHETVGKSWKTIVEILNDVGVKPADIASALRTKGQKLADVAAWLEDAGVSARRSAAALRSSFGSSLRQTVSALEGAGFDFAETARAVWYEVIRRAPKSTWPKAIADLGDELAKRFSLNLAWVMGELAKLGIKP